MTREIIAQRIMQCTPRELQRVLNEIRRWEYDFGDENAGRVKTVQEIIDLLARPEYIEEAERIKDETGEDYFKVVFDINNSHD